MSLTYERTDDYVVTISDEGLRHLAAENMQRIVSARIYEITAGAGLGGAVAAVVWFLAKPYIGG